MASPEDQRRPSLGDVPVPGPPPRKLQKTANTGPDDFSNSVRKKLSSSSRTGQACDRCKVRKIRCDPTPGGCTPCRQNNTQCKTTDRITGRATTRGHTESLEWQLNVLKNKVIEYEHRLRESGLEYVPLDPSLLQGASAYSTGSDWPQAEPVASQGWGHEQARGPQFHSPQMNLPTITGGPAALESNQVHSLPEFRGGCKGDNYLGISSTTSVLSNIKGTSLSFFGMEVNVADFIPDDVDDPSSPSSYEAFLEYFHNRKTVPEPPLPPHAELQKYALWFFRSLHAYTPILHKPTFMGLIDKIFANDGKFKATAAETVMVHMMLAQMKFQYAQRNGSPAALESSLAHYTYSVTRIHDLLASHTVADVQALEMICFQLRNFAKPGAFWFMTNLTFGVALELGLHRSAKAWPAAEQQDPMEIENRRRAFWIAHLLHVGSSGKLGRPIPIRIEDIDIEYPEPIDDSIPEETGLSEFRKCSFQVGLQAIRIVVLLNQMWSTIYSIRSSPQNYEETVRRLEEELQRWRNQIPPELAEPSRASAEEHIWCLYIQFWDLEFQLNLRHPAVCPLNNPHILAANSQICLDVASRMLEVVDALRVYKSLDVPWINLTVYLAAIFTTLFVQSQRQEPLTTMELDKLKSDMDRWLLIMKEVGHILGSGDRLQQSIGAIVRPAIDSISSRITKNTAAAAVAALPQETSSQHSKHDLEQRNTAQLSNGYNNTGYSGQSSSSAEVKQERQPSVSSNAYLDPAIATQATYPSAATSAAATGHYYTDPSQGNQLSYTQSAAQFGQQATQPGYVSGPNGTDPMSQQAQQQTPQNHAAQQAQAAYMYAAQHAGGQAAQHAQSAHTDWIRWGEQMRQQITPQPHVTRAYLDSTNTLNSANTLMALGGQQARGMDATGSQQTTQGVGASVDEVGAVAADMGMNLSAAQGQDQTWPLAVFSIGQAGGHEGG